MPFASALRPAARVAALAAFVLAAPAARAEYIIDLTAANTAPVTYQGAVFSQTAQQPAGTGVFDPFVRIQMKGTESGYNTDARKGGMYDKGIEFDTKDGNQWTHSLPLNSLQSVTMGGVKYYQFTLDINEKGQLPGSLLSMNDFQLYLGDSASLTGFKDGFGFGADSVKLYDLNADGGARVDLNAKLNPPGSGVADLNVYVPAALFDKYAGTDFQYVYLYSAFGNPYASDAGFEEWSARTGPNTPDCGCPHNPVPAPPAVLLGLIGAGSCLIGRRFRTAARA